MLLSFFDCHKGEEVCVHLLANGLRPEEIEKVRNVVKRFNAKFEVYEVDGDFLGSLAQGRYSYITPTTYARLFLPDILPAEVDKVLYLDCDLIVLDSLESLWKYDFDDGTELAAVEDSCSANVEYYDRLHLPKEEHRYFNAGVLLINLKAWREGHFVERAKALLDKGDIQLHYADQDVLNILSAGKVKYLPFRFNLQEAMLRKYVPEIRSEAVAEIVESLSSPAIIHFTYKLKPWCYRSFHPYRAWFYHYFDQTEWSGERPKPTMKERVYRLAWWGASLFNLVNTYHPLPPKFLECTV